MSNIYYGIGKTPKGYKPATQLQAINKGQVRRWGINQVNPELWAKSQQLKMRGEVESYRRFHRSNFRKIKKLYPEMRMQDINRMIGQMWNKGNNVTYSIPGSEHLKTKIPIEAILNSPINPHQQTTSPQNIEHALAVLSDNPNVEIGPNLNRLTDIATINQLTGHHYSYSGSNLPFAKDEFGYTGEGRLTPYQGETEQIRMPYIYNRPDRNNSMIPVFAENYEGDVPMIKRNVVVNAAYMQRKIDNISSVISHLSGINEEEVRKDIALYLMSNERPDWDKYLGPEEEEEELEQIPFIEEESEPQSMFNQPTSEEYWGGDVPSDYYPEEYLKKTA